MKKFLLAISLLAFAACKKQAEPSGPKLGAPDAGGYTRELVPAAATVTASSGPVKITLSMPTTSYRAADHSLWVKYTITNVGKEPFSVMSEAFFFDPNALMRTSLYYVEVQTAKGGYVPFYDPESHFPPRECWPEIYTLPETDFYGRVFFFLPVGKSTSTVALAYQSRRAGWCDKEPRPRPIGDFGQIKAVSLFPGKYRIRAGYHAGTPDVEPPMEPTAEDVTIYTPWIAFEATH
ncbi:MAG: hypothetical protein COX66_14510 [Elusimicrobia bacterium CG_4_10_14_0_2_um_filter_63_34]|nr:MAG: hypothetical protein COX66_14510 [Elusimicrobia bacterium CG_4_10_14_0_2_um_filter_63_34]